MATTKSSARGVRRSWTIALATAAGVLGIGIASLAHGSGDPVPGASFWSLVTPLGAELNPPQDVHDLATRADAIVVARATAVLPGREEKGVLDPVPPISSDVPLPRTVFVQLTVGSVITGSVAPGSTLNLEMSAPPSPVTLDDLRARLPADKGLFFLWNSATQIHKSGLDALMDPIENTLWKPVSSEGVIAANPSGLYEVLKPDALDATLLGSFNATTLDDAVAATTKALH